MMPKEIYLDNSATTRVSKAAAEKALYMMTQCYGNPSSLHSMGFAAEKAGGDLKSGLLLAVIFPAALLACALAGRKGGARNGPF